MKESIYYNGEIATLHSENEYVEAVLVKDGKIKKTGDYSAIKKAAAKDADRIDLNGTFLMPAFIDAHSHITAFAFSLGFASLGKAESFDEITDIMKEFISSRREEADDFIIGCGYDHTNLEEGTHPTREVLDRIDTEKGIVIVHASGHMAVASTKALRMLGIGEDTPDPQGGRIGREEKTGKPDGYLEEKAFMQYTPQLMRGQKSDPVKALKKAQDIYLSYGITTAQDGLMGEREFSLLKSAAEKKSLKLDVVGYLDLEHAGQLCHEGRAYLSSYRDGFRIGGCKIILDGSPQGKTAWMREPYENSPDGYRGYPVYEDARVKEFVVTAGRSHMQLMAHCNGDAACEQFICACEGEKLLRPVMIHAQLVDRVQLKRMKRIGMIPSFFAAHTWYWGDVHRRNLGEKRAASISPAKTAGELALPYTFHQDTPVLMPDMLETVWCAVNRRTRSGHILGEERISVYDALKAVTRNGAFQYSEEAVKGTIEEGKLADFVILDRNPWKAEKEELKEIKVLETVKEGKSLYRKG